MIINKIVNHLYPTEQKYFFLNINNNFKFYNVNKSKYKNKKKFFFVVKFNKNNLLEFIKIILKINKNYLINYNFLIFYNFKKELVAQNIIYNWPDYKSSNFFENLFDWFKKNIYIFLNFRNIYYIVIKSK